MGIIRLIYAETKSVWNGLSKEKLPKKTVNIKTSKIISYGDYGDSDKCFLACEDKTRYNFLAEKEQWKHICKFIKAEKEGILIIPVKY